MEETVKILTGLKHKYESYHELTIDHSALHSAASLSFKYIHDRRLPDKAIDLIDEACSLAKSENCLSGLFTLS